MDLTIEFGWESQFLVMISGTPFGSGILILFLIPEIPVVKLFLNSTVKNRQIGILIPKLGILKKLRRNSVHLMLYQKNVCRHTYIYSKWLLPYLHLLKTVAAIPTSTQNGCCHTYIYSKRLPPYLHLLKTAAAIPTSTQNGCCHTYMYSKRLLPYLHLLKTAAAISISTQVF